MHVVYSHFGAKTERVRGASSIGRLESILISWVGSLQLCAVQASIAGIRSATLALESENKNIDSIDWLVVKFKEQIFEY